MEKFLDRAEQLGHSRTHLREHGWQTTTVTLNDIEQVRKFVHPLDPAHAEAREAHISGLAMGRERTLGEHIESYLYGTGDLSTQQVRAANKGLPVTIQVSSLINDTMPHGETVIGPSGEPVVWNRGTLQFYSDSYLTVKNNFFTLDVQNLVMQYTGA